MAIDNKIRRRFEFLPGEKVYHEIRRVGLCSSYSPPSSSLAFSIPFFLRMSLHITDRRVVLLAWMFGLLVQEYSAWFPDCSPENDTEIVKSARLGHARIAGPYLEIITGNDHRQGWHRFLCSPEIRGRYYMKSPEPLYDAVRSGLSRFDGWRSRS